MPARPPHSFSQPCVIAQDWGPFVIDRLIRLVTDAVFIKRLLVYLCGLFTLSFGLALFLQSGLGLPVNSAVAFVLSRIIPIKYSVFLILVNLSLVLVQFAALQKDFRPVWAAQIPIAFLFGWFVDLSCRLTAWISLESYFANFALMVLGISFLSLGIALYVEVDLVPLPLEGVALAFTQKLRRFPLSKVKRAIDLFMFLTAAGLSLLFLGRFEGVREGTAFAALFAGKLMGVFQQHVSLPLVKGFIYNNPRNRA